MDVPANLRVLEHKTRSEITGESKMRNLRAKTRSTREEELVKELS